MLWMSTVDVINVDCVTHYSPYTSVLCYPFLHSPIPVKDSNIKQWNVQTYAFYCNPFTVYYSICGITVPLVRLHIGEA